MRATAADMEIDDSLLTKTDEELYGTNAVTTTTTTTTVQPKDIPMPPPKWTSIPTQKQMVNDEGEETDFSTASSTDQEDLRNRISKKEQDLRNKLNGAVMININIAIRERKNPEGTLYPSIPERRHDEILVSHKNFHNDLPFHQDLERLIRTQVECSPLYQKMKEDGHIVACKDRASYKTIDETSKKPKSRYSKLYHVFHNHQHTNKYAPYIEDRRTYVFVKVDLYPSITDPVEKAKADAAVKLKEETRQRIEDDKKAEEEREKQKAIDRLTERGQKEGVPTVILWPQEIEAEMKRMKEEKDKEDEECRKKLALDIQRAREKQAAEQKKNHAAWMEHKREKLNNILNKTEDNPTPEQQAQPGTSYNQYQTNGLAVRNSINALKVIASYNFQLTETELAHKLRQLYQEFLHDSAVPENQVRRRNPLNYEPRYISKPTLKRQRQQEAERSQPARQHNRPQKRQKQSGWDTTEPTLTWEQQGQRQNELGRAMVQAFNNDSDWD